MKTYLYRASNEVYHHSSGLSFMAEVSFWRPLKTIVSSDLFIIIIIIMIFINFFRQVFSECTALATSQLVTTDPPERSHQPGPDFIFPKRSFGKKSVVPDLSNTLGFQSGPFFTTMRLRTQLSATLA